MRKSIVQNDEKTCFLCGRNGARDRLEKHHIFGGANRKLSDEDGLFIWICGDRCHRNGRLSAHKSAVTATLLHEIGQKAWEKAYGSRAEFAKRYGKNFLEAENE